MSDVRRMTARVYARECGISKDTVYEWVRNGNLPKGATATRTNTNRIVIHIDERQHPEMPLLTEPR